LQEYSMLKTLVVLALAGAMSAPALAQAAAPAPAANSAQQPAKPQTVKKRVCYQEEADSYSRLGGRKICKVVDVPATSGGGQPASQNPAPTNSTAN
jgi:hypothetical protein